MNWTRKHLLGLEDLSADEINIILDTAESFREASLRKKKAPPMTGYAVVMMFVEPSTRTLTSFSLAARRLGADLVSFSPQLSSLTKGETLVDTAKNIQAMGVDTIVIRHTLPGAPHLLARELNVSIVNAGDGSHEHPTQALLDIFTIRDRKKKIEGLTVAIVGDIKYSRVARSNIWGLKKLGARVIVVGPATLIPAEIEQLGVEVCYDLDKVIPECDVINILRIQLERQKSGLFPSVREYARIFGLNSERLERAKKDLLIMHPGPMNRGIEITPEVADGPHSVVLDQVANGLAVRMAVLNLVAGVRD